MDAKQLAEKLNGRTIGNEISKSEAREAADAGLVIAYGYSDDNLELEGAIRDECGAYNGTKRRITRHGFLMDLEDYIYIKLSPSKEDIIEYLRRDATAKEIRAEWCKRDGYTWFIEGDFPYEAFWIRDPDDEPGHVFCRGIVFRVEDLG